MARGLVPIILSCGVWGPYLTRQCILFQCNNYSLVAAINRVSSKHPLVMHLLRCLWLFVALYDIDMVAEHIAGATNQVADMLSINQSDQFLSQYPQESWFPTLLPPLLLLIVSPHKLDWTSQSFRDCFKDTMYLNGSAPTTRNTYAADQKQYITFCSHANRIPIPTSESTLLLFVTHLTTLNLSYATIKVYLSAVRHMHVTTGQHSKFTHQLTPHLQQVLKGIQKTQSATQPSRQRLPITLSIMQSMKRLLLQKPPSYDNVLIWAACCLAFFDFLWVSEFTVPAQSQYDHSTHLSISDVSINNKDHPQLLHIWIRKSKTDPFRQG